MIFGPHWGRCKGSEWLDDPKWKETIRRTAQSQFWVNAGCSWVLRWVWWLEQHIISLWGLLQASYKHEHPKRNRKKLYRPWRPSFWCHTAPPPPKWNIYPSPWIKEPQGHITRRGYGLRDIVVDISGGKYDTLNFLDPSLDRSEVCSALSFQVSPAGLSPSCPQQGFTHKQMTRTNFLFHFPHPSACPCWDHLQNSAGIQVLALWTASEKIQIKGIRGFYSA